MCTQDDDGDLEAALDALVAAIEAGRVEVPPDDDAGAGLGGEGWEDPDCSPPREYAGVPLREILAEAGARAAAAAPEAWAAGFLPRDVPAAQPSPGPAGGFASGGALDIAPPEPVLAAFAEEVTGPDGRCAGTTDDELIGVLRAWQRSESRAAARKLAVIAELIRRRPAPGSAPPAPGGMPRAWGKFCADELAAATACSGQAAEKTLTLAYDLATRLPGTARALSDGAIDTYKARIIADTTRVLGAADAIAAEAMILPGIAARTPGQIRAAIGRAVIRVNPGAARERREQAQKDARVELWREDAGTAALCGRDLPPAEVLAADQRITAYALELKAAGLKAGMDQLRARAFLDFVLGTSSLPHPGHDDSPACPDYSPAGVSRADGASAASASADDPGHGEASGVSPDRTGDSGAGTGDRRADADDPRADAGSRPGTGDGCPAPGPAAPGGVPAAPSAAGLAARINLTIPLATLLGLAERPGEIAGLGALDPALARDLAAAAAGNPRTTWCLTVTDQHGHPTAHGCAHPVRTPPGQQPAGPPGGRPPGGQPPGGQAPGGGPSDGGPPGQQPPGERPSAGPPDSGITGTTGGGTRARPVAPRGSPPGTGNQDTPVFTPEDGHGSQDSHGPPGGYGRWQLRTPGPAGRDYTIDIGPIPVTSCDHRHESAGYQPSDTLRHLVEIRDGECTWPPCRRAARACDFEHAIPYDQGGRTCACNAGARCRHHHHAKQNPSWRLDQNVSYHTWTTPSGRTYTAGPISYPI